MITIEIILFVLLAYITGAFPSAVWVGKTFYKTDVREYGSGNAGATNTFRVLGKGAGIPVLFMDIFKGWLAVYYVHFISNVTELSPELFFENQLAFGIAAVIVFYMCSIFMIRCIQKMFFFFVILYLF